jgi:hypothetical protein
MSQLIRQVLHQKYHYSKLRHLKPRLQQRHVQTGAAGIVLGTFPSSRLVDAACVCPEV